MKIWVAGDCLILKSDDLNFPKQSSGSRRIANNFRFSTLADVFDHISYIFISHNERKSKVFLKKRYTILYLCLRF
jgi:hypothetical protein